MAGFGMMLGVAGLAAQTVGIIGSGQTEAGLHNANAAALRSKGDREYAIGTVNAARRKEEADRVQSEQELRYAASGGGLGGSAAVHLAEVEGQGIQNSNLEVWKGEQARRGYQDEAAISDFPAKQRRKAIPWQVGSAILSGGSRLLMGGSGSGSGGNFGQLHYG